MLVVGRQPLRLPEQPPVAQRRREIGDRLALDEEAPVDEEVAERQASDLDAHPGERREVSRDLPVPLAIVDDDVHRSVTVVAQH